MNSPAPKHQFYKTEKKDYQLGFINLSYGLKFYCCGLYSHATKDKYYQKQKKAA